MLAQLPNPNSKFDPSLCVPPRSVADGKAQDVYINTPAKQDACHQYSSQAGYLRSSNGNGEALTRMKGIDSLLIQNLHLKIFMVWSFSVSTYYSWWLLLYQLDEAETQLRANSVLLGMLVNLILEEIIIWVCKRALLAVCVGIIQSTEAPNRRNLHSPTKQANPSPLATGIDTPGPCTQTEEYCVTSPPHFYLQTRTCTSGFLGLVHKHSGLD